MIYQVLLVYFDSKLNCDRNSTKNLRTVSGSLVLTAIQESYENFNFTSATIITKQTFNIASNLIFELRAALPLSDIIFTNIFLIAKYNPRGYGIFLLKNFQRSIRTGFILPDYFKMGILPEQPVLTDFNIYYLQFNLSKYFSTLSWSSNGNRNSINKNFLSVPFHDNEWNFLSNNVFKLGITLEVRSFLEGGDLNLVNDKSKDWKCSSLIIDYVRIHENSSDVFLNKLKASEICHQVSEELGRNISSVIKSWASKIGNKS